GTGQRFGAESTAIEELASGRDEERPHRRPAEAHASRVGHRHLDDGVDTAVRRITHHAAAGEDGVPDVAFAVDARSVGTILRLRVVDEDGSIAEAALANVEVELPRHEATGIREVQALLSGRDRHGVGDDHAVELAMNAAVWIHP